MPNEDFAQLDQRVKNIENALRTIGGLTFPLDAMTKGTIENTSFATLKALILIAGLPLYTTARDTSQVASAPNDNELWIEDISSVQSLCFFRNGTKVCMPFSAAPTGTYSPTRSAETNLDSNVTFASCKYIRIGNMVVVSGRFTADPTAGAPTATSFEMTLPIASNLGAAGDVSGVAFCGGVNGQGAEIIGVAANDTAKVQWQAVDTTSKTWSFVFTYQVI